MDKLYDANTRRITDMHKLKQCLERLKCDLYVISLSRKLNKEQSMTNDESTANNEDGYQEMSTDSDRIVNEQIQTTLDLISKIETNI